MHPDPCSAPAFAVLAARAGIDPDQAGALHAELVARHAEPHRRYHTLTHVAHVLEALDLTAAELTDDRAVRLAAWFHDAVYDPTAAPGENEARSAALAEGALAAAGGEPAVVAATAHLVQVTAHHQPTTPAEVALVDADLAVLGAPPDAYARYVERVRAEHPHVDDDAWRVGRAAVLRGFLSRPRVFHGRALADREARARANLGGELAGLERSG